jgi:membrane protein
LYWSVLTLGPLLLIAATYVGRQVTSAVEDAFLISRFLSIAGWIGPIVVGILVVGAIYSLLPNTDVPYRAAVAGAIISVPLWLVAKWAFSIYVTKLVGTGNLYGALGLLPLFLLWLNLSWSIFLYGAELANVAANLRVLDTEDRQGDTALSVADLLAVAIAVAQSYRDGSGPVRSERIAERLGLPGELVALLLEKLELSKVVCAAQGDGDAVAYVPARPAEAITVSEILGVDSESLGASPASGRDAELQRLVARAREHADSAFGRITLAQLIETE